MKAKLFVLNDEGNLVPFNWGNGFRVETYFWGSRIICSTDGDRIELLTKLLSRYPGPFGLAYILQDNRGIRKYRPGRYVSQNEISLEQAKFFFHEFRELIEFDGRHHLMVSCSTSKGAVVFDQHDYFYVYGGLDELARELASEGFVDCDYQLGQHGHPMSDDVSDIHRLMSFWRWGWKELEATDISRERTGLFQYLKLKVRAKWFDLTRRPPS